jgi:hypothetical protein
MQNTETEFVSRREAARLLGVAPVTVIKLSQANNVRTWKVRNHNRCRFHRGDILSLLENNGNAAGAGA